jgi:hypothetical protein
VYAGKILRENEKSPGHKKGPNSQVSGLMYIEPILDPPCATNRRRGDLVVIFTSYNFFGS